LEHGVTGEEAVNAARFNAGREMTYFCTTYLLTVRMRVAGSHVYIHTA